MLLKNCVFLHIDRCPSYDEARSNLDINKVTSTTDEMIKKELETYDTLHNDGNLKIKWTMPDAPPPYSTHPGGEKEEKGRRGEGKGGGGDVSFNYDEDNETMTFIDKKLTEENVPIELFENYDTKLLNTINTYLNTTKTSGEEGIKVFIENTKHNFIPKKDKKSTLHKLKLINCLLNVKVRIAIYDKSQKNKSLNLKDLIKKDIVKNKKRVKVPGVLGFFRSA